MTVSPLVIRLLHVLSVGGLLGGTAVIWLAFRVDDGISVPLLSWFEGIFWGAIGMIVFTGLGNLAAFGVPDPDTTRGVVLTLKLGCLLLIVVGSVVRTFAVVQLSRGGVSNVTTPRLRWLYALTGWSVVALVLIAGVLTRV